MDELHSSLQTGRFSDVAVFEVTLKGKMLFYDSLLQ